MKMRNLLTVATAGALVVSCGDDPSVDVSEAEQQTALIAAWGEANEACMGAAQMGREDPASCDQAGKLGEQLADAGYCYGDTESPRSDWRWQPCSDSAGQQTERYDSQASATSDDALRIKPEDQALVERYGACLMINRAGISILNSDILSGYEGSYHESNLASLAHQATVYEILLSEIYDKYKESIGQDDYLKNANSWRTSVYLPYLRANEYSLTMNKVLSWEREICRPYPADDARRIEQQYGQEFIKAKDNNKNFRIPTTSE